MSEEVKEETAAPEEAAAQTTETADAAPQLEAQKKKINRFTQEELNKKIAEMEEKNLTTSTYYKHLQQRQRELNPPAAAE